VGVTINGKTHNIMIHRIIWLLWTGSWPKHQIDHIDGNRKNNRILNLREATKAQNQGNRKVTRNGLKGVTRTRCGKPFQASIWLNGKNTYLGRFDTERAAHEAYMREARNVWGEFARAA
jgi:hypothetical protein